MQVETVELDSSPAELTAEKIVEEMVCCQQDLCYWLFNYVYTKDERTGRITLFPQYPFIEEDLVPAFLDPAGCIILKSRQMLVSWLWAAGNIWECNFYTAYTNIIRSCGLDEAKKLKARCQFIYEHLPVWMQAELRYQNTTEMVWRHRNTQLICTAGGRSYTAHRVTLDEFAHYGPGTDEEALSEVGPSVEAGGILNIISSPNGKHNAFARVWKEVKKAA